MINYEQYKNKLIEFFKGDEKFKDYNYTGSNLNILLDILSRNAHYVGFYSNMLFNESIPKTARRLESLKGYALRHNFLIQNNSSAKNTLSIKVEVPATVSSIYIPKNTKFSATNELQQQATFITLQEHTLDNKDGNFITGDIVVHEGELKTDLFTVSHLRKYYQILDEKVDISTLKVSIKDSETGVFEIACDRAKPDILPQSNEYNYYVMLKGKYYEIFFGNDAFGYQPKNSQFIKIEYLHTNGNLGNNTINYTLLRKANIIDNSQIDFYGDDKVTIVANQQSAGGVSGVNFENLQLALSSFSRTKSVAINDEDYKSVILGNYSDISSIAVWGGEKNNLRQYGKLFISIKPVYGKILSTTIKENVRNFLVKNYGLIGDNIIFVDPNYMYINMKVVFAKNSVSKNIDNNEIKSNLIQRVLSFDKNYLGKFDLIYNEKQLLDYIGEGYENSFNNLYTKKELNFDLPLIFGNDRTYEFDFKNPLLTFKTETFDFNGKQAYYVYDKASSPKSKISMVVDGEYKKEFGTVNLDTGYVEIFIPKSVDIRTIKLIATPIDNSIETTYDRILQIGNIDVEIK